MIYKVWTVYENESKQGVKYITFKYYVINTTTSSFQSSWPTLNEAGIVCRDLNALIRKQAFIERSHKRIEI